MTKLQIQLNPRYDSYIIIKNQNIIKKILYMSLDENQVAVLIK